MPIYQYCSKRNCSKFKTPMMRVYIRSSEGKEVRDAKYSSYWRPKIRKQIFKSIGWLCPRCTKLYYDKGFWREPEAKLEPDNS